MPKLPQELIDHIIDHISDRSSLKACSLVCSQWYPRIRKRLFVRVDPGSGGDLQLLRALIRPRFSRGRLQNRYPPRTVVPQNLSPM